MSKKGSPDMSMYISNSKKQGYLHIKRERSSSPVATRVLFRPWQQAYFILRTDPYILEEYKDASLKTQKQIHFIGTVKHVGIIRTSKSQQFAFEVVMQEKTPLLLACDNQILRDEWIGAFTDVMLAVSNLQGRKKSSSSVSLNNLITGNVLPVTYEVEIIETSLSTANDLHGGYLIDITSTRMSLINAVDYVEVLSWPHSHMSFYKSQPSENRVILVMGRNCHFGGGKLIFETKDCENVVNLVGIYFSKIKPHKGSFTSRSLSGSSADFHYKMSPALNSQKSPSNTPEEERAVFNSPEKECKTWPDSLEISENIQSGSVPPDLKTSDEQYANHYSLANSSPLSQDSNSACDSHYEVDEPIDGHVLEKENNPITFPEINEDEHGYVVPKNVENDEDIEEIDEINSHTKDDASFAEITSEDSYILPNEAEIDDKWHVAHSNFSRFSLERTHVSIRSRNNSETETEASTTYLQILEEEDAANTNGNDPVHKLLENITSSLENPMHNQSLLNNVNSKTSKSTSGVEHTQKQKVVPRRSSEPLQKCKATRSFEKESGKTKLTDMRRSYHSYEDGSDENIRTSSPDQIALPLNQPSPQLSSKTFNSRLHGFPKQNSITHRAQANGAFGSAASHFNPSNNPFHKAESFLTKPLPLSLSHSSLQHRKTAKHRNITDPSLPQFSKVPEPDRNTKPKRLSLDKSMIDTAIDHNAPASDVPPPLPERISPKNLRSPSRKVHEIKEEAEQEQSKSGRSSENSSHNSLNKLELPEANITSGNVVPSLVLPPPLPPKAKLLAPTKSAPLSGREGSNEDHVTRSSSFTTFPHNKDREQSGIGDEPPEVPSRDHLEALVHQKHISSSESDLLQPDCPPKLQTPPMQPKHLSRSLDTNQFSKLLTTTVTHYEDDQFMPAGRSTRSETYNDLEITEKRLLENNSRRLTCPAVTVPKLLKSPSNSKSMFPKSPKKFF